MNRISKIVSMALVTVFLAGCTEDESFETSEVDQSGNKEESVIENINEPSQPISESTPGLLKSIVIQYYDLFEENLVGTSNSLHYKFHENKITTMETNSAHFVYEYEGDLISKIIEYDNSGDVNFTTYYEHQNGKLISRVWEEGKNLSSTLKEIDYGTEPIHSVLTWSGGGTVIDSITMQADGLVLREDLYNNPGENDPFWSYNYTYEAQNLVNVTRYDTYYQIVTGEREFEYLDIERPDSTQLQFYLFGPEWKNNVVFENQFGIGQSESAFMSKNYIKSYKLSEFENNGELMHQILGTFEYEFDSVGNLLSETEIITFTFDRVPIKKVTTYIY